MPLWMTETRTSRKKVKIIENGLTVFMNKEKLFKVLEIYMKNLPLLESNAGDSKKDMKGIASYTLLRDIRSLAVANYVLYHDIQTFKSGLCEAALIQRKLFERFEKGEPIHSSFVSMLSYRSLFDALAAGDIELAMQLASYMGGRDIIEREYDNPFTRAFGYTLKNFVLGNQEEMKKWLADFIARCRRKCNAGFEGYARIFNGIIKNETGETEEGFNLLIEGHKRLSKGYGMFKDTADEDLCVWGIGMANLAHREGLIVKITSDLIPADLLI